MLPRRANLRKCVAQVQTPKNLQKRGTFWPLRSNLRTNGGSRHFAGRPSLRFGALLRSGIGPACGSRGQVMRFVEVTSIAPATNTHTHANRGREPPVRNRVVRNRTVRRTLWLPEGCDKVLRDFSRDGGCMSWPVAKEARIFATDLARRRRGRVICVLSISRRLHSKRVGRALRNRVTKQ